MKKIVFLFILLLSACSSNKVDGYLKNDFVFSDKMNFEDFKIRL